MAPLLYACDGPLGYAPEASAPPTVASEALQAAASDAVFSGRDLTIFAQATGEVTFWATAATGYGSPEQLFLQQLTLRRGGERDAPLWVQAARARLDTAELRLLLEGDVRGSAELMGAGLLPPPATAAPPRPPRLPAPPE